MQKIKFSISRFDNFMSIYGFALGCNTYYKHFIFGCIYPKKRHYETVVLVCVLSVEVGN